MSTSSEDRVPLTVEEGSPVPKTSDTTSDSERNPLVSQSTPRSKCRTICKAVGRWMLKNLLLILTIASVVVGFILGLSVRESEWEKDSNEYRLMITLLSFPGEIFLRLLKMLILPLIVFSLIAGLGSLESKVAGSLGWKTVLYYFSTTFFAIVLGLVLVVSIQPGGRGLVVECDNSTHASGLSIELSDTILDLIRNMLPDNLFEATFSQDETYYYNETITDLRDCLEQHFNMTLPNNTNNTCPAIRDTISTLNLTCANSTHTIRHTGLEQRNGMNILGIIIFTVAFAIALSRQPGGRKVVKAIAVLNETIMKLVSLVMWYSPIGIASIIAGKLAEVDDFGILVAEVGLYTVTVMVGLIGHSCITLPLLYLILTRKNPLKLVRAVVQALLTAFGTSSSSATLPVTIQNLEDNFKADSRITRFMLPVGATINMDGTALYEAVAAVFIAQVQGLSLSFDRYIIISITATLASVGAAGVPQAGLFTLVIVLVAVGLDPENVALILAVDWMLDRFRTTANVLGDSFGVGIVQHYSRKQLSKNPPMPQATGSNNSSPKHEGENGVSGYGSASSSQEDLLQRQPSTLSTPQWSRGSSQSSPQVYLSEPMGVPSEERPLEGAEEDKDETTM